MGKLNYVKGILEPNSHVFEHMQNIKDVLSRVRYTPSTEDKAIVEAIDEYIMIVSQLEEIRNDNSEIESEFEDTVYISSWEEKVERANQLLRFEMNGNSPQFYYYDRGRKRCPCDELYWVLFQQCLYNEGVNVKYNTNPLLRFLRCGMRSVRHF